MTEKTPETENQSPGTPAPEEENVVETPSEETPEKVSPIESGELQFGDFEEPDYGAIVDAAAKAEETSEEVDDFVDRPMDPPELVEPEPTPPEVPAEPEATPEPTPEPVVAVETPESPPEVVQPVVETPPVLEPPAAEETPVEQPTYTDEQYREAMVKHQAESIPKLEALYKLSEAEAADIDDPSKPPSEWLPGYLAKMHYNVHMSQRAEMQKALPDAVQGITSRNSIHAAAEAEFFGEFPALVGQRDAVSMAVMQVRATNPKLEGKELREKAAQLTSISLGIPLTAQPPVATVVETPVVPAAPIGVGQQGAPVVQGKPSTYEEGVYAEMIEDM